MPERRAGVNNHKICFIMCSNDEFQAREARIYIEQLQVPEHYETEVLTVVDAVSMTSGYNEAMNASDAKYKVYMHQDVLLLKRDFLYDALEVFQKHPEIGMLGVVGNESVADDGGMWSDGMWRRTGEILVDTINECSYSLFGKIKDVYSEVIALDGLFMMTQYDIPWREDLFEGWDYYDVSQSMEFWRAGYKVVVPHMNEPWCLHENDRLNMAQYDRWRKVFLEEYGEYVTQWMLQRYPAMNDVENQKKIEKLGVAVQGLNLYEIKPEFNLNWYKGEDHYSEGAIEDVLAQLIWNGRGSDYRQEMMEHFNWSVYYHLTPIRENLLNWYPFPKEASVLEIGCGLGAVTNLLCRKCRKVTAVELSKRRAAAAVLRCFDKENLEVIVGDLTDIEFSEKYDIVTLIGVLEYQGNYSDSVNPYVDFLKKIRSVLKPGGKLLIAIENKYGLKYWCGAKEDHTGVPFDGLNQYQLGNQAGRTFSKRELSDMILQSGFRSSYFYYPLPDYKLPRVLYSEEYLPREGAMSMLEPYYIPDMNSVVINETNVYDDLIQNQVFEFFANSFLIECSDSEKDLGEVVFALPGGFRKKEYRIGTRIKGGNQRDVEKFPLDEKELSCKHIQSIRNNMQTLLEHGLNVLDSEVCEDGALRCRYVESPLLVDVLKDAYEEKNTEKVLRYFDLLKEEIEKSSEEISSDENILYRLDMAERQSDLDYGRILKNGYLDMIPKNCFVEEGKLLWFDQEWVWEGVPVKYMMFRCIMDIYTYSNLRQAWEALHPGELLARYQIDDTQMQQFYQLENYFNSYANDKDSLNMYHALPESNDEVCRNNVGRLLNGKQ